MLSRSLALQAKPFLHDLGLARPEVAPLSDSPRATTNQSHSAHAYLAAGCGKGCGKHLAPPSSAPPSAEDRGYEGPAALRQGVAQQLMRQAVLASYRALLRQLRQLPRCAAATFGPSHAECVGMQAPPGSAGAGPRPTADRACRRERAYYQVYLRENFVTYNDEPDEDKIAALLEKATHDAEYVLQKVRAHLRSRCTHAPLCCALRSCLCGAAAGSAPGLLQTCGPHVVLGCSTGLASSNDCGSKHTLQAGGAR